MSSSLTVYRVDIEHLISTVCGSGDRRLFQAVHERFRSDIAMFASWDATSESNRVTALEQLVMGPPWTLGERGEHHYTHAFEYLVGFHGVPFDEVGWTSIRAEVPAEQIDRDLAELGAQLRSWELAFRGPPVGFPYSAEDGPWTGYWSAEQVVAGEQPLAAAHTAETELIGEWVRQAAAAGHGIVGFHHS